MLTYLINFVEKKSNNGLHQRQNNSGCLEPYPCIFYIVLINKLKSASIKNISIKLEINEYIAPREAVKCKWVKLYMNFLR